MYSDVDIRAYYSNARASRDTDGTMSITKREITVNSQNPRLCKSYFMLSNIKKLQCTRCIKGKTAGIYL
jgi:hypothetical protein